MPLRGWTAHGRAIHVESGRSKPWQASGPTTRLIRADRESKKGRQLRWPQYQRHKGNGPSVGQAGAVNKPPTEGGAGSNRCPLRPTPPSEDKSKLPVRDFQRR
jgi:hypothetical protein